MTKKLTEKQKQMDRSVRVMARHFEYEIEDREDSRTHGLPARPVSRENPREAHAAAGRSLIA